MALTDTPDLRDLLVQLLPGLTITDTLLRSGQRLVYFCQFSPPNSAWGRWGKAVLKVSQDIHPSVIARLEKERDILNELRSDYFPTLHHYDVFSENPITEAKLPYRLFVTIEERVPGGPLSARTRDFASEAKTVCLLQHLVRALTYLWSHPKRIVHRDLKPDNIIIRPDDTPAVIDLGIVREEGSVGVTDTGFNIGPCTLGYASPEQLKNEKMSIDFRSDVFSLGALAYELLSDRNPFRHDQHDPPAVILHRTLHDPLPALSDTNRCSVRLSTLISSMLSKEPYQRPRTWLLLREELDAIAGGALP